MQLECSPTLEDFDDEKEVVDEKKVDVEKKLIQMLLEEDETEEVEENEDDEDSEEVDWNRMFTKGICPADVKSKVENLEAKRLTGEWYMHRSSEFLQEEMTPTCHHAMMNIKDDGSFTATEEAAFMDKTWIGDNITGQFTKNAVRADFFDKKLSIAVTVLDTDYDNYLIGYECFDNMRFALENDIEPVHITKIAVLTHKPEEELAYLTSLEDKVIELLPFFDRADLAVIKQGKEGKCIYQEFKAAETAATEQPELTTTEKAKTLVTDSASKVGTEVSAVGDKLKNFGK